MELDPGLFPFNTDFIVLLVKLNALRSSSLEAKYCDNDFVDEEEEARSSSGVLVLVLGCNIPATLEPLLKKNLCPGFTFHIDPHQTRHFGCGGKTADAGRLLAQVTRDNFFFGFAKYFSGFSDKFWICKLVWDLQNNISGFNSFIKILNSFSDLMNS